MRANRRWLWRGLRMLVLSIVLVLAPAKSTRFEGAFAATPMLVLSGVDSTPPIELPRAVTSRDRRIESPARASARSCSNAANPIRVFARYLEDCSWLC